MTLFPADAQHAQFTSSRELMFYPPEMALEDFLRAAPARILVSVAYCFKNPRMPAA